MAEGLRLKVEADLSQAEKALDDFVKTAQRDGKAAAVAIEKPLANITPAVNKAVTSLNKIPRSADQATGSLINMGRVVQDAPFGFLGVANNLNPLIEGFGRLRTSAGGTGGAFKALGASMLGAGGLAFGVSLVSSALLVFGDRLFGSSKAAKAADESLNNLSKKFADQAVTLTSLVGIVQNVNSSYDDKKKALQALNQEYGTYLKQLDAESITADNVAQSYERIVDAMLRQAVVKGIQDQISAAVEKTAKELIALQINHEKVRIATENQFKAQSDSAKAAAKQAQNLKFLQGGLDAYNRGAKDGVIAQQAVNDEQTRAIANTDVYKQETDRLKNSLIKTLAPLLNLTTNFEDLNIQLKDLKKVKPNKPINIPIELNLEGPREGAVPFIDETLKKLRGGIFGIFKEFDPNTISDEMNIAIAKKFSEEFAKINAKAPEIDFTLAPVVNERFLQDALNKAIKKLNAFKDLTESINKQFQNLAIEGFAAIGDAIGTALAGGDLGKVFANFGNIIGGAIQQIGKQLIEFGTLAILTKKALASAFANPGFAIGVGIALSALGAVIKSSLSKGITGFAQGGLVFGPTLGLVGEGRGTRPSNPEVIAPLDKLKDFLGNSGAGQTVVVVGRVRGNDIELSNNRTKRQNRRMGG